ncbi:MAG: hypothetical protein IKL24_03070 [Clostridia bacterium]|nr:hypothetical protein [Clostridia bacterium]
MARNISSILSDFGANAGITYEYHGSDADCVVFIGCEIPKSIDIPFVYCSATLTDPDTAADKGEVVPYLSSGRMARAAMLLLPDATHFFILSRADGAVDVQSACDIFDASGVDYTVEVLGERTVRDAVISFSKKGADGIIVPFCSPDLDGISLAESGTGLITVGENSIVNGSLATFCPDTEALSYLAASKVLDTVYERADELKLPDTVKLLIDPSVADALSADIFAVKEDYEVYLTEKNTKPHR